MRPNRILRYLLVALFVTLGLLTRDSGGVARAEPVLVTSNQPRMVGTAPLGTIDRRQQFQMLVNRFSGEALAFGYLSYIHGLDEEELYLEDSRKLESKALFTFYIEGRIVRLHRNGPLLTYELQGQTAVFFDGTPNGDFSDPETFRNGTRIATGEVNGVYTFEPGTGTGTGTGDVRLRQTRAFPFEFNGELIQFGEVGNHTVSFRGTSRNLRRWTRVFGTSTVVQAAIPTP